MNRKAKLDVMGIVHRYDAISIYDPEQHQIIFVIYLIYAQSFYSM